jgi:hypothetical protein
MHRRRRRLETIKPMSPRETGAGLKAGLIVSGYRRLGF